jgi:hypothetical protein
MDSIFTVPNDALNRLSAEEAVARFRDLLWAEARRFGISISKMNISSWINIPDGGIDASVDETAGLSHNGLIKAGRVGYQIKADSSFKPWQKSQIKENFLGAKLRVRAT